MKPTEHEYHSDAYDIDIQACSTMDCTGLIPTPPRTEEEQESYEELYPYLTRAIPTAASKKEQE